MAPSRRRSADSHPGSGFTLIELLVVIAIIAILTAILLPVFASVREGSRQSVAISNLKDIQQKMEQYKLDNHKYPDVLFGYAYPGSTMKTGLSMAQTAGKAAIYFPGLYPAYIKDPNEFTDPNNPINDGSAAAQQVTSALTDTYIIYPCNKDFDNELRGDMASDCANTHTPGDAIATQRKFYTEDAYDSSPTVLGGNNIGGAAITRYQTVRVPTAGQNNYTPDADYTRQMRWQNPPADTVVTITPYHVQNADKVLILFSSGTVQKVKAEDFLGGNADSKDTFWKVKP